MIKWDLSLECKNGSISTNQSMWYTTLTNWRTVIKWLSQQMWKKHFTNLNIYLWLKTQQTGYRGNIPQQIMAIYDKPTAKITLDG